MKLASALDLQRELTADFGGNRSLSVVVNEAPQLSRTLTLGVRETLANATIALSDHVGTLPVAGSVTGWVERSFEGVLTPPMFGIALGEDADDFRIAVRVERLNADNQQIVESIQRKAAGEVDLAETGRIIALAAPNLLCDRQRPLCFGCSTSHIKGTAGSVTAFVEKSGQLKMLSNAHVVGAPAANRGEVILQPGRNHGGKERDQIGRLDEMVHPSKDATNTIDAALCDLDDDDDPIGVPGDRFGSPFVGADEELLGVMVEKLGCATGTTLARVSAINFEPFVWYERDRLTFTGQLELEGRGTAPVVLPGDSGAMVYRREGVCRPVAQLFAGSPGKNVAYATPLGTVLKELDAEFVEVD